MIDDIVCSDHFPHCIEMVCDVNKLHDATHELIAPEIIAKLECGKFAGPDGICAEYLKFLMSSCIYY